MKSKGEEMLGDALKSRKRSSKKRGMVAGAVNAYTNATKGLQNVGQKIGSAAQQIATANKAGGALSLKGTYRKRSAKK